MESVSDFDSDEAAVAAASPRSWSPAESSSDTEGQSGVAMTHLQRMRWVKAKYSDFRGKPPSPRCGHTGVCIGHSKVVFFGGFVNDRYLNDIFVYDIDSSLWYMPECTGGGSDGHAGPCPRAFHVAVPIGSRMFIFGGRSAAESLGDLWMLDTAEALWEWSALNSFGDMPCAREFSSAAVVRNRTIVIYGGWDGRSCLSDIYILDTQSLEWKKIAVAGLVPPPRCGHSFTLIDNMLVIFGGRGGTESIFSDLWALNGIAEEEDAGGPTWTQLILPGLHARCGHSVTSGGHHVLLFGGHGTEGWRKECIILQMGTEWMSLQTSNEPPPPRSYHSLTCMGHRFLLFGGFDGKRTFADLWWLVIEDDPIAKRGLVPNVESDSLSTLTDGQQFALKETFVTQSDQIKLYIGEKRLSKAYISFLQLAVNFEAIRYKIRAYRQLSDAKKKRIPELLLAGETVLTSFRISDEYLQLLPHEIYRYRPERALEREPESQSGQTDATTTPKHDAHCVVLISPGYAFKDERDSADEEEVEQTSASWAVREPERYYEYLNSYTPEWGLDGCGAVYEESLRKTYRIRVEDI